MFFKVANGSREEVESMADQWVRVTTFAVGQGLCELIEIYQGNVDNLVYLALSDCGSNSKVKKNKTEYVANVENMFQYISEKAIKRKEKTGSYFFDMVSISHQDTDHWNLLMRLLTRILEIPTGEYISIQDECGTCTQYVIDTACEGGEMCIYFSNQDNDAYYLNYMNTIENYEESQSSSDSYYQCTYVRTWKIGKVQSEILCHEIEISILTDDSEGGVTGVYNAGGEEIIIEYTMVNEGEEINASLLANSEGTYFIYQDGSEKFTTIPSDLTDALEQFFKLIEDITPSIIMQIFESNKAVDLGEVQAEINKGKPVKKVIDKVYFGGTKYKPRASDFKVKLSNMANVVRDSVCYEEGSLSVDGISYTALIPLDYGDIGPNNRYPGIKETKVVDEIERNRTSLFMLLAFRDGQIVFPGDATVHTMMSVININSQNGLFKNYITQLLVAPHHGSDTTSANDTRFTGEEGYSVLLEFLEMFSPVNMHISSGIKNNHYHPGESFINYSWVTTQGEGDEHPVYYYDGNGYQFFYQNRSIWTTVVEGTGGEEYSNLIFHLASESGGRLEEKKKRKARTLRELPASHLFV